MKLEGRSVLVIGMGRSGNAALELLRGAGARSSAYDRDPSRLAGLPDDVERHSGDAPPALDAFDLAIASPGVSLPPDERIVPEVDLAAEHLRSTLIGVTGTNGKSTTTALIAACLRESGLDAQTGGNFGTPLCALVESAPEYVVAELSSFQLERARRLRPRVGVLLNLAPDHLDRHGSLKAYAAAKARLADLQRPGDTLVFNADDPWARDVRARDGVRRLGFSERSPQADGAFVESGGLVLARAGRPLLSVPLARLSRAARSPLSNALAAAAAAHAAGAALEAISGALCRFEGLPHRGAEVCTRGGVRYVDASKATNPAAAAVSLSAEPGPLIWLAGGRNKGLDFGGLSAAARGVRLAVLFGESGPALAESLAGSCPTERVARLADAVVRAAEIALPGETVLLAPACASFDEFRSFEERGARFAELARSLSDGGSA
ncbi:MAG: UDP-N-acetylmuramoyl-L-alanine--D-glutamate ligase [Proteobacteria bacterium]|nr:UDP-N-acetylmuramoyl-L-alanine--D-glutamate ligase [Pseudomonadota bacterium]